MKRIMMTRSIEPQMRIMMVAPFILKLTLSYKRYLYIRPKAC